MSKIKLQGEAEKQAGVYYEIDTSLEPLGIGGMGTVYRGVRVEKSGLRRDVAVKFLYDDLPDHTIDRARREASIQISNENLIEMFGFIEIDEADANGNVKPRYHVASELLTGVMLFDLMRGTTTDKLGNEIPFAQELHQQMVNDRPHFALRIAKNVLSGLMALHDKGFVHRDIDPSNIMVTADCKIKVIDFGIAKQIGGKNDGHKLTSAGQFLGKPAYASPELALGDVDHQDATTDLYAVGVLLYELMTGHVPFEGPMAEVLKMQVEKKLPMQEISYRPIRKIIDKATAKRQSDRYRSAAEFRVAIEQVEATTLTESPMTSLITEATQITTAITRKSKRPVMIAAVSAIIVVVGIVVWLMASSGNKTNAATEREASAVIDDRFEDIDSTAVDTIVTPQIPVADALEMLASSDGLTASKGFNALVEAAENGSSEAAYTLGRLHHDVTKIAANYAAMKTNAGVENDPSMVYYYDSLAYVFDANNYHALYELGCDHLVGSARGTETSNRALAQEYILRARDMALDAGDTEFIDNSPAINMFN